MVNDSDLQKEEKLQKEVQYYSAITNAWLNTKLEKDKSLLTLSGGGVGFLVTLLTTIGVESSNVFLLYCIAIFSFVVSILAVVFIFGYNAKHLEKVLEEKNEYGCLLRVLDRIVICSFFIGVILSFIIGILSGLESLQKGGIIHMGKNDEVKKTIKTVRDVTGNKSHEFGEKRGSVNESFDGIFNLKPKEPKESPKDSNDKKK